MDEKRDQKMERNVKVERAIPGGDAIASGDGKRDEKMEEKVTPKREEMLENVAIWTFQVANWRALGQESTQKSKK